ncbi:hypothetical protein GCM10009590_02120 [Brachybacterium alimentarium]
MKVEDSMAMPAIAMRGRRSDCVVAGMGVLPWLKRLIMVGTSFHPTAATARGGAGTDPTRSATPRPEGALP